MYGSNVRCCSIAFSTLTDAVLVASIGILRYWHLFISRIYQTYIDLVVALDQETCSF